MNIFLISLFATFSIVRLFSHYFHDRKNYGTKKEDSKTITGWLRRKTKIDWHHIHFGILLLIITTILHVTYSLTNNLLIFYGVSLSLIADQIIPLIFKRICYFSKDGIFWACFNHVIIALIFLLIFKIS